MRQNGDIPFQSALLQDFDMIVLVLHEEQDREHIVRHTIAGDQRTQSVHIGLFALEQAVMAGDNNELLISLMRGK